MSSEETLIQVRREKHQEINGGKYPLASEYNEEENLLRWHVQAYFDKPDYIWSTEKPLDYRMMVRGRITIFRKSGGITFVKVTDSTGSIQIIFSRASYPSYEGLKLFDLGDIVEVTGSPIISKTGEKSIMADSMTLLTKAHRPPPEKFHGIADEELKYRKRYLDLMGSEESRARFVIRSTVVRAIREYMDGQNFMEVETSTLSSIASGANAKPFETHHNALDIPLRLRIAPELNLKRLLVGGFERVYEIGRNYRNEGIDTRHNPEFTMMESYQAYGRFPELITFTKSLLHHVINYCAFHLPEWAKTYFQQWRTDRANTFTQFAEVTMLSAVLTACDKAGIHIELSGDDTLHDLRIGHWTDTNFQPNERLQRIDVKAMWQAVDQCSTFGEEIAALFEHVAEPFLTEDYRTEDGSKSLPVFITEFPKETSPLARTNDRKSIICDRFELFVDGRELANAFQELNDPDEQALRFKEQLEAGGKDPMAYDADYVEALQHGMPPAIGFGMGIDRLVMLLTNTSSIKDVILFPTLRPEQ